MMAFSAHIQRLVFAVLIALLALGTSAVSASAAPKIKNANAVDADSDGSVDGFDVTFSAKVLRGKGKASSRAFSVSGYRVTSVAKPRGKRVRVRVAEGAACDVGARPRISYRGGLLTDSRKHRLRRSRVDLGRKDRRAPRIACAVTGDGDRDGHLDTIVVTWSRPVRSPATSGSGQFGVDRYSIQSAGAAKGRFVTLKLKEKTAFDTGDVPAVFYRRPKKASRGVRATAKRRGVAATTTYNDTRDRAAARLISASTADASLNGLVDGVSARFSETVKADATSIAVAGARVTRVDKRGRDGFSASVAEGPLRGDSRPQVSFGTAAKVVRDLAGNAAPRTSVQAADGAAPVIVAARTLDRGGAAARLDTVALTFSERVLHPGDSDGSYPFGVTGYAIGSAGASSGTSLELALTEDAGADTGARPPVGYTRGAGAPVRDAAGNEAASHVFAGVADSIAPRLVGATTVDGDADGQLDRVRFDFTEPITSPQRSCATGCGFSAPPLAAGTALAGVGAGVELTVAEGALNGGLEPFASYSTATGGAVRDVSGNAAPAASVAAADGAAPVALDSYTADADANGRIDELRVGFSEPLDYPGDSAGATSFSATGYTVQSADPASGATLTLNLTESADPDTGSAPAMGYTGQGGVALRDANGVEHAHRSWPNLTRDAAPPVFVEAHTADLDAVAGNETGKVDAVELVYSEEITGTADVADFQVDGAAPSAIAFDPQSVKLRLDEGPAYDTDTTKSVSYAPGDLTDVQEGPGDTADAAPAASTTAQDGALPAIVAAETADTQGAPDGRVDHVKVTLSEAVNYVQAPAAALGLTSPTLVVSGVTVDSATELTLTVAVDGSAAPDGGATPAVTVTETERVTDGAGNGARSDAFAGTVDEVAPVLLNARLGEAQSGACGAGVVDGSVDCVRATWSEDVTQPADSSGLSLDSPFTVGALLGSPGGPDVDAAVAGPATANRDAGSQLTYTGGGSGAVVDLAGNPSLSPGTVTTRPACKDIAHEPNDVQDSLNPVLTGAVSLERICSGDEDWFRISPDAGGQISVRVDPGDLVATTVRLVNPSGGQITIAPSNGLGVEDVVQANGLSGLQYLHVSAPPSQEGAYCIDTNYVPGELPCNDDEPSADQ